MVIHPDQNFFPLYCPLQPSKTFVIGQYPEPVESNNSFATNCSIIPPCTGQRCRYRRRCFANQGLFSKCVSEWNGV